MPTRDTSGATGSSRPRTLIRSRSGLLKICKARWISLIRRVSASHGGVCVRNVPKECSTGDDCRNEQHPMAASTDRPTSTGAVRGEVKGFHEPSRTMQHDQTGMGIWDVALVKSNSLGTARPNSTMSKQYSPGGVGRRPPTLYM